MKLIVDISDEMYELCKRGTTGTFLLTTGMRSGKTFLISLYKAIANGKPLPKGHGRLIDADAMRRRLFASNACETIGSVTCAAFSYFIKDARTIIEADKESEVEE